MSRFSRRSGVVRALVALSPALLRVSPVSAQQPQGEGQFPRTGPPDVRLPNGKMQRDEILKADYEQNVIDAAKLSQLTANFQLELEKSDRFVLSLGLLKRLDDIEKLTKRIRSRMKR